MKPVLFEITEAQRLVKHYDFLKKRKYNVVNEQYSIDNILIAPDSFERFNKFLEWFSILKDNTKALSQTGFNSTRVQIILVEDYDKGVVVYAELDTYLTENNIAKVYDIGLRLD